MKYYGLLKIRGLDNKPIWIMSNRKITEEEVHGAIQAGMYSIDLRPFGFGWSMDGGVTGECYMFGGSKEEAKKLLDRLNDDEDPWDWFAGGVKAALDESQDDEEE